MFKFQHQNKKNENVGKNVLGYTTGQEEDYKSGQLLGITNRGKSDYKQGAALEISNQGKKVTNQGWDFKSVKRDFKSGKRLQIRAIGISNRARDYKSVQNILKGIF